MKKQDYRKKRIYSTLTITYLSDNKEKVIYFSEYLLENIWRVRLFPLAKYVIGVFYSCLRLYRESYQIYVIMNFSMDWYVIYLSSKFQLDQFTNNGRVIIKSIVLMLRCFDVLWIFIS